MRDRPKITSEAALCAAFIEQFNAAPGWTCYPETAGFDILVVHEDGRQIGVEAKLKLNAKVADQILPGSWAERYGQPGPDHRMVIVADITDASLGIARLLEMCGVHVRKPYMAVRRIGRGEVEYFADFEIKEWLDAGSAWSRNPHLFDWNPAERCAVPCVVPDVPAGVPCPLKLTPWKESAIRVLIQLRRQGWITTKEIAAHGISSSVWVQGPTAWLQKGVAPGQWVITDRLPNFESQHPAAYAQILAIETEKLASKASAGLDLG